MAKEDSREKFVELAEKRVQRTLKDIKLIGNLSNRSNYKYTDADVKKIIKVLRQSVEDVKARFERRGDDEDVEFKL